MVDKVSVLLFGKFASDRPQHVSDKEHTWKKGFVVDGIYRPYPSDEYPVFGVKVEDADQLAQWLGGKLPTQKQWDKAAGRFAVPARPGPFKGEWTDDSGLDVAVASPDAAPRSAGSAGDDISSFGCRDMAGNGWEWTRDLWDPREERQVPSQSEGKQQVILRGQSYAASRPLFFEDLSKTPRLQSYELASPDISFRVVIEPRRRSGS